MKQLRLLPSGCQVYPVTTKGCMLWTERHMVFASTLVVNVYSAKTFELERILQDREINKTITSLASCPHDDNLLAVASFDGRISLWRIREETIVRRIVYRPQVHITLAWGAGDAVLVASCDQAVMKILQWQTAAVEATTAAAAAAESVLTELVSIKVKSLDVRLTALRCNPKMDGQLAIGCSNGVAILFNNSRAGPASKAAQHTLLAVKDRTANIVDLQWDPLSCSMLLVAYAGFVSLWDAESGSEMFVYESQPNGVSSVAWMGWAPGCFLSTNPKTGTVRVWNVSQKQPLKLVKVAKEGLNAVNFGKTEDRGSSALFGCVNGSVIVHNIKTLHQEFSTPALHTETIFDCKISPASPDLFASCSFDGTVKLWQASDFGLVATFFAGDVVYSCEWSPDGRFLLAGCSTGRIILWDTESGREVGYFQHHSKACYCLCWNPFLPTLVCSTSGDGRCVVFDLDAEALADKTKHSLGKNGAAGSGGTHSRSRRLPGAAYAMRVAESEKLETNTRMLYSPGNSSSVALFGVMWCPTVFNLVAIGAQDGSVRVLDFARPADPLLCVLVGHSARSFQCIWSPLVPGLLASGGDDRKVLVWRVDLGRLEANADQPEAAAATATATATSGKKSNYPFPSRLSPARELLGHTSNVRALSWNYEHKHILLSGSWDSTIKIWNVELGTCLRTISDHVADVYSIASHPARPFTYMSSSRDSTIRQWELEDVFLALKTSAVVHRSLDRLLLRAVSDESSASSSSSSTPPLAPTAVLCGRKSRALNFSLAKEAKAAAPNDPIAMALQYYAIFNFFSGASGALDVWECALALLYARADRHLDTGAVLLRPSSHRVVLPEADVLRSALSDAKKQESQKRADSSRGGGEGLQRYEDELRQAALAYARAGNLTKYCELLVDLGDWPRALAVAPGVSLDYWRALTQRHATALAAQADEQCVPHLLAVGARAEAVNFYLRRKSTKQALVTAVGAAASAALATPPLPTPATVSPPVQAPAPGNCSALVRTVVEATSRSLVTASNPNPALAAAYHLASGLVPEAVQLLEASGDLDLAFALRVCFGLPLDGLLVAMADALLETQGAELGLDTALELLGLLSRGGLAEKERLRARYGHAEPEQGAGAGVGVGVVAEREVGRREVSADPGPAGLDSLARLERSLPVNRVQLPGLGRLPVQQTQGPQGMVDSLDDHIDAGN